MIRKSVFLFYFLLGTAVSYGNSSLCYLGGNDPSCSRWNILSTIVYDTCDADLTAQAIAFLQNVTCNCQPDSSIKLFLPNWTGDRSGTYQIGTDSNQMFEQITSDSVYTNAAYPMDTVNIMMENMTTFATGMSNYTNKAAYIFTNVNCNAITDNNIFATNSLIYDLLNQNYSLHFIFFENTYNNCSIYTYCTARYLSYPTCGIYRDTQYYSQYSTCPASIMPTTRTEPQSSNYTTSIPLSIPTDFSSTSSPPPTSPDNGWQLTPLELGLIIGIPCATLVCCCAICACCCCKCLEIKKVGMLFAKADERNPAANNPNKYRDFFKEMRDMKKWMKKGKFDASAPPIDPCTGQIVPNFAVSNHYMDIEQLAARNKKDDWEFQVKNLLIHENEVLGCGAFASVYRCTIIGKIPLLKVVNGASATLENNDGRTEAAVKRLPAHADDQNKKDFFHEMEFMKRLGYHVHIIAMLGCVSDMWDPLIAVEYCHYGDLLRFVRGHRTDFFGGGSSSSSDKTTITLNVKQLVSFAWQASDGVTYLASKNFVHRDLAARNILVTKNLVAKVSDFGLCRYTDEALYTAKGGKLPIKWMSPEALKFGEFSIKSDVWSFGVLLWEIFSLGETPYNAIQPTDMLIYLEDGSRLPRPQFCPHEIYKVAQDCWQENAEKRPTIDEIRSRLTLMLNINDESYGYLNVIRKDIDTTTCPVDGFFDEKM